MKILVDDEIVMRPINTIKPYVRNARKNEKTVQKLVDIIPKVGFNVPLVIDENGVIVKGHARFSAGIRLGMTELPCIITHADPESIKADRILDNKISELSEWVFDKLADEIEAIDTNLYDIGFPKIDMDIPTQETVIAEQPKADNEKDVFIQKLESNLFYKVVCEKCGHVQYLMEDELPEEE